MYEYTINAYNTDSGVGRINSINVTVQADSEEQAIKRASEVVQRTDFAVIAIKVLTGVKFKKG